MSYKFYTESGEWYKDATDNKYDIFEFEDTKGIWEAYDEQKNTPYGLFMIDEKQGFLADSKEESLQLLQNWLDFLVGEK